LKPFVSPWHVRHSDTDVLLLAYKQDAHRDRVPDDVENGRGSLHVLAQLFELSPWCVGVHRRGERDPLKAWPRALGQTQESVKVELAFSVEAQRPDRDPARGGVIDVADGDARRECVQDGPDRVRRGVRTEQDCWARRRRACA